MELSRFLFFLYKNLNNISKCKFYLGNPKKNKFLLFDEGRLEFLDKYKIFKNIQIINVRFESIYLLILLKTIFTTGIKSLSKNYIKNYIIAINPKIIITFTDYNPTFFLLKKLIKKPKFKTIAIQSSFRSNINFKVFKKKLFKKYECDYYLFFNEYIKKKNLEKIFTTKFINIGSFRSNTFKIKKRKNVDLLFLSGFKSKFTQNDQKFYLLEKKTVSWLVKFSKNYNYSLKIIIKDNGIQNVDKRKKEYIKYFNFVKENQLLYNGRYKNNYQHIDSGKMIVFNTTSLGVEAIGRGAKVLSYAANIVPFNKKKQFFYGTDFNYNNFIKKLKTIMTMKKKSWKIIVNNSNLATKFDFHNKIFLKIIRDSLQK
jgi:surface carbohydrate biosynthesis protein